MARQKIRVPQKPRPLGCVCHDATEDEPAGECLFHAIHGKGGA